MSKFKKVFAGSMISLLALGALAGCSSDKYYTIEQDVYKAQVVTNADTYDDEIAITVTNEELNKNSNMNPAGTLYYEVGSESETQELKNNIFVYALVTKYRKNDETLPEYSVDAVFKTQDEANESFPIVEKSIPTKVLKKLDKKDGEYLVVALEEKNGKVSNVAIVKATGQLDNYKEDGYYMMKIKFSGPNAKVLSVDEEVQKSVYDEYMKNQNELKSAS